MSSPLGGLAWLGMLAAGQSVWFVRRDQFNPSIATHWSQPIDLNPSAVKFAVIGSKTASNNSKQ
ncbi:hypothetical protein [Limnothrix redekei]|uniref:Uncharacterized protein n=1 Tax=Limnothrix redekei LRLZ20PSL1 TaxID=3112953 RepID=A0ABW7CB05_9CYAN